MTSFLFEAVIKCFSLTVQYLVILPHKLIPAGQIWLQQHIRVVGRWSQQVGEQQWHLELLTRAPLQEVQALCSIGPAAVGQLVKLTVGDGRCVSVGAIDRGQRKGESKGNSLHSNCPSDTQNQTYGGNVKCCIICFNSYPVHLIVTFQTRIPVVIQTSLCSETL